MALFVDVCERVHASVTEMALTSGPVEESPARGGGKCIVTEFQMVEKNVTREVFGNFEVIEDGESGVLRWRGRVASEEVLYT